MQRPGEDVDCLPELCLHHCMKTGSLTELEFYHFIQAGQLASELSESIFLYSPSTRVIGTHSYV